MRFSCSQTSSPESATASRSIRDIDRDLLKCLLSSGPRSIGELQSQLGVTATAVRQRIDRLTRSGCIEREKHRAGRGRPIFRYGLTLMGRRRIGADAASLAEAIWQEILCMADGEARERLVAAVAKRMGKDLAAAMDAIPLPNAADPSLWKRRLSQLAGLLESQEISASVDERSGLPVLAIHVCPFPGMADAAGDRNMCRLEEKMFSEAIGQSVSLTHCRLDGEPCCQFSLTDAATSATT